MPKAIKKYNFLFPIGTSELEMELIAYRNRRTVEEGGLGAFQHFKNIVDALWNRPNSPCPFVWNDWSTRMVKAAIENKYLALAGCASSGKSASMAMYAMVEYLSDPSRTLILITSTTVSGARERVWKYICNLWAACPGIPGKLVDSRAQITGVDGSGQLTGGTGIKIIPAGRGAGRGASENLIGIKQPRNGKLIVIFDEMPDLVESVLHAAYGNLSKNPGFEMKGMGNPNSYFDPFGMFAAPVGGWETVTEKSMEWKTSRGLCIRFDAENSPNLTDATDEKPIPYPWLPTQEQIEQDATDYGVRSLQYFRFVKGFWAPEGVANGIYAEADLVHGAMTPVEKWDSPPVKCAGLDPSFTKRGDRTVAVFGDVGFVGGVQTVSYTEYVLLEEDVTDKSTPRTQQIAGAFRDECVKRGVQPYHAAIDATGGGGPLLDVLHEKWSPDVLGVMFGGAASDLPVSATDNTPSKDRYADRMSEIWYVGRELLRSNQLRGIMPELAKEMVSREFEFKKRSNNRKIKVEPKSVYKDRVGKSPDIADSAFVLVDLARQRLNLAGGQRFESNKNLQKKWGGMMMTFDDVVADHGWLVPE